MDWNESLMATGVDIVDRQHQEIIRRVNCLIQAAGNGDNIVVPKINKLIDFLADYVIAHFISEEVLQIKINYSDLDKHKQEHEDFIRRFTDMRDEFYNNGATAENIQALISLTENWLKEHIAVSDARFAAEYRKINGINLS